MVSPQNAIVNSIESILSSVKTQCEANNTTRLLGAEWTEHGEI